MMAIIITLSLLLFTSKFIVVSCFQTFQHMSLFAFTWTPQVVVAYLFTQTSAILTMPAGIGMHRV